MRKLISIFTMSMLLAGGSAYAENRDVRGALITKMTTYTQSNNGDVIISLDKYTPTCDAGFWLNPADPGYDAALSVLLAAYHANAPISVGGEDADTWSGSGSKFCRIVYVENERT